MATVSIWPAEGLTVNDESGTPIPTGGLSVTLSTYYRALLAAGWALTYDPLGIVTTPTGVASTDAAAPYNALTRSKLCTDLTALSGLYNGAKVHCAGYYVALDGGGGDFYWDSSSTTTADNGMVFGAAAAGRWKRIVNGFAPTNVLWFGAKKSTSFNSTTYIQNAINYVAALTYGGVVYFPGGGEYRIQNPGLVLPRSATKSIVFQGDGVSSTVLSGTGMTDTVAVISFAATAGVHCYHYGFRDMTIYRGNAGRCFYYDIVTPGGAVSDWERLRNCLFSNILFRASQDLSPGEPLCTIQGGHQVRFKNVGWRGGNTGLYFYYCSRSELDGVYQLDSANQSTTGIFLEDCTATSMKSIRCERGVAGGYALKMTGCTQVRVEEISFEGGPENAQIYLADCFTISIRNAGIAAVTATDPAVQAGIIIDDGCRHITIEDSLISSQENVGLTYKAVRIADDVKGVKIRARMDQEPDDAGHYQFDISALAEDIDIAIWTADVGTDGVPPDRLWRYTQLLKYTGTATWNPGSLADGAGETFGSTITVTGAALGDIVDASFSLDLQGIQLHAWVSAANTVKVRLQNETGSVIDLGSGTVKVCVRK